METISSKKQGIIENKNGNTNVNEALNLKPRTDEFWKKVKGPALNQLLFDKAETSSETLRKALSTSIERSPLKKYLNYYSRIDELIALTEEKTIAAITADKGIKPKVKSSLDEICRIIKIALEECEKFKQTKQV